MVGPLAACMSASASRAAEVAAWVFAPAEADQHDAHRGRVAHDAGAEDLDGGPDDGAVGGGVGDGEDEADAAVVRTVILKKIYLFEGVKGTHMMTATVKKPSPKST